MKHFLFLFLLLPSIILIAQDNEHTKQTQLIVDEGKALYKREMASWYGTDIFLSKWEDKSKIGGYFSYLDEADVPTCLFFSKDTDPKVLGTIAFDADYNLETARVNLEERELSDVERDLYTLRQAAIDTIQQDTIFEFYQQTNFNLIPIIWKGKKKVYILTGPSVSGVVIFGNDYLLEFDDENKIESIRKLHNNIIPLEYGHDEAEEESMHSHNHNTGDFITATDVCTLMLYGKYTQWKRHHIVSPEYLTTWDFKDNSFVIIPKKVIDKILKDQEKRKAQEEKQSKKKKKRKKD